MTETEQQAASVEPAEQQAEAVVPAKTELTRIGSLVLHNIPPIAEYKLKMLIYGPPGSGKTTLAASANACAAMAPALFVAVDPGTLSLSGFSWAPQVVDLTSYAQLGEVFSFLRSRANPFKTVIIDSLSELQLLNLDAIVRQRVGASKAREDNKIFLEDYGDSTRQLRNAVRAFRELPLHVIFTAHESATQDDSQQETVFPAITNKLRIPVIGYVDVLGYLTTTRSDPKPGEPPRAVRRLITQPYGKYQAKDRTPGGRLGLFTDNPSMGSLVAKIYQEKKNG